MVTAFAYNGTGGCNSLLPTSTSYGSSTTTYFATQATYDCASGKVLNLTDANGNLTISSYTAGGADPLYRIKSIAGPLGETTTFGYTPTSSQSTLTFPSVTESFYSYVDTLGRLSKEQSSDGTNYDTVMHTYAWGTSGASGSTTSVPCSEPLGSPCSSAPATFTYLDALGRTSSVVDAGGGTTTYTYIDQDVIAQLGPAPAGENVKKVQTEYDGLGRVKSVCGILVTGGSSCGQATGGSGIVTAYTYSLVSGGSKVVATRGGQSRTSLFDGLGRVVSVTTPEAGTLQYIYDTQTSVCAALDGIHSSPGDVVETIDNSSIHTCYEY